MSQTSQDIEQPNSAEEDMFIDRQNIRVENSSKFKRVLIKFCIINFVISVVLMSMFFIERSAKTEYNEKYINIKCNEMTELCQNCLDEIVYACEFNECVTEETNACDNTFCANKLYFCENQKYIDKDVQAWQDRVGIKSFSQKLKNTRVGNSWVFTIIILYIVILFGLLFTGFITYFTRHSCWHD